MNKDFSLKPELEAFFKQENAPSMRKIASLCGFSSNYIARIVAGEISGIPNPKAEIIRQKMALFPAPPAPSEPS